MTYAVATVSSPPDSRPLPGPVTDPVAAPGPGRPVVHYPKQNCKDTDACPAPEPMIGEDHLWGQCVPVPAEKTSEVVLASESAPGRGDEVRQVLGLAPLTAVAMPGRCEDPRAGTLLRRTPESIEIGEIADALSWTRAQCLAAEQTAPSGTVALAGAPAGSTATAPPPGPSSPPCPVPNLC